MTETPENKDTPKDAIDDLEPKQDPKGGADGSVRPIDGSNVGLIGLLLPAVQKISG
jgi:hypothetical protein